MFEQKTNRVLLAEAEVGKLEHEPLRLIFTLENAETLILYKKLINIYLNKQDYIKHKRRISIVEKKFRRYLLTVAAGLICAAIGFGLQNTGYADNEVVEISGSVYYENEKPEGAYFVWWQSPSYPPPEGPVSIEDRSFSLSIPENTEELRLMLSYHDGSNINTPPEASKALPLKMKKTDIELGRVDLEKVDVRRPQKEVEGPTVELSGEIRVEGFTHGPIDILLASPQGWAEGGRGLRDISLVGPIMEPGAFTVEAPADREVYLSAVYYHELEDPELRAGFLPNVRRGAYGENPVKTDEDIGGLIIIIPEPSDE